MQGTIDSPKKCNCGGSFKYDENQNILFCQKCANTCPGPYRVRFGRKITRNFKNNLRAAQTFLLHLRHQKSTDNFDLRDYARSAPLGFVAQATKWLEMKKEGISKKHHHDLESKLTVAADYWGNKNVKTISEGDIEDFLFSLKVGAKTRNNFKSALHSFWKWLKKREAIRMPEFPACDYKLGMRQIIDIPTQQAIIDEIYALTYHKNPKIWLAIRMLSRYFHIRPGELMRITEGNINLEIPVMILPPQSSKIGEPTMVFLWDDDVDEIRRLPKGLPGLPFFRHGPGKRSESGKPFGKCLLYRTWTAACRNLGLMRDEKLPICDLYGGTRHSTMTAMSEFMTPEEVQQASGHRTTSAMTRYLQGRARYAQRASQTIADLQERARRKAQVINLSERKDR